MKVGVPTCSPETPIVEIAQVSLEKDFEGFIVLNEDGHALGVVSRFELVKAYGRGDYDELTAGDIMRDGMPEIPPDIPLAAAAQLMQDQNLRVVFLGHHAAGIRYPAAMLTYKHLLRHMASQDGDDLDDLGIRAEREMPLDSFFKKRDQERSKNISEKLSN